MYSHFQEQIKNVEKAIKSKPGVGIIRKLTKNQFDYVFIEPLSKFDYNAAKTEKNGT